MARGDQLSRQWKIIQTLMAVTRGKTKHQLAAELDCHPRTVYRDLEALQAAGFPLLTEQRDNRTYWSILDHSGNRNRHQMPLPLSLTELMALYFSRNMLKVLQGTAIYESLTSLFEKVKATLPLAYSQYLETLEHSLQVGVKAFKPYQRFQETLRRVSAAAQQQRYVQITYYAMGRRRRTLRKVAPYKIWFYDETFYVIGHCELRGDLRLFAVDRIEEITLLDEPFELPAGFDAEAFMESSFGIFRGDPVKVRIRFSPQVAGYIAEKIWHPSQVLTPADDGGVIFCAEVAGLEEIKLWVLRWGAGATVLEPEDLRAAIIAETGAMAANYQSLDG